VDGASIPELVRQQCGPLISTSCPESRGNQAENESVCPFFFFWDYFVLFSPTCVKFAYPRASGLKLKLVVIRKWLYLASIPHIFALSA
jgi:hypothetical protein